ncbi:MAG: anion transporter [Campylobacteraceae bacterium 4484_4]|nr:MAG: anion transporter [Campylobacteraceae bacterium 4484_4]
MRGLLVALVIGGGLFALALLGFSAKHALLIAVVAFLVTLWTNGALPLGVVSLLPVILFPALGIMDAKAVVPNYSKTIIFLFLGGFMIAIAMEKIKLHKYFSAKLLSLFPRTATGIIYALAITSATLSSLLSNTTITLMLMPIGLFLTQNTKLKVRFLIAIAYGASIGGIITPIGTPPNMLLLGFLEDHSIIAPSFGKWMVMVFPVALAMLLTIPWLLSRGIQHESVKEIDSGIPPLTSKQKRMLWILGSLAVLLLLNTKIEPYYHGLGLNEKLILLGYGLLMFMPKFGFLEWEDTREMPYEIVFLFGAGFTIAAAFIKTGLAADIAHKLSFISDMPLFWMLVAVALFVSFTTEVTSNTALTSIALPIFYEFAKEMPGQDGLVLMMVATIAASYAFMLPIATPPNAIIMSSRVIRVSEMAKVGVVANFLGVFVVAVVAYLLWR